MLAVPTADLYLRLSDFGVEEAFDGREAKLRALASALGWDIHRVIVENDMVPTKDGRMRPASAFKRRKIRTPSGGVKLRTVRPGFREVLEDITTGRANAMLAEDLDRVVRDPRDLEDLIDACELRKASARSLSGSLTLTEGGTDSEITTARFMVAVANKSSRDTSRRVKEKKEALHGQSYTGGGRPYGLVPVKDTEKYHRNLMLVPDEAEVLRAAARDILDRNLGLFSIVNDLNGHDIPTVRGGKWTSQTLKQALLKPAVAGLAVHKGNLKPAPWPAILEVDVWQSLKDKLTDPDRRTSPGNQPRWLLTFTATCGICNDGTTVTVTGSSKTGTDCSRRGYQCRRSAHLRRNARNTDAYVEEIIVRHLDKNGQDILKPPVRQGIDTSKLRAEAKRLRERKAAQIRMHAAGDIDDADLAVGMREIRDRLAVVDAQLRQSSAPDPLAEFRDQPARAVWHSLPMERKRAIVKLLADVVIMPSAQRGRGFDPDSVVVTLKA